MRKLARIFLMINVLSLDVAAGAIASALFFCKVFGVSILPVGISALGLTVWIIYTADHLLDVWRKKGVATSFRHRFHQQHFVVLTVMLALAALTVFILLFYVRRPLLEAGIGLGVIVVIYMVIQRSLRYVKELSGGLLYCAGVLLPAVSLSTSVFTLSRAMLIAEFSLVVLFNLLLFAFFDIYRDTRDKRQSFATLLGIARTRRALYILFAVNVTILAVQLCLGLSPLWQLLALALMIGGLFALFIFSDRLNTREQFRPFGDAVFLIPMIFVLI